MTIMTSADLDAYFARIGYAGPRTATLGTLRSLHLHHVQAVPFENLDILLGRLISLEPDAIIQKIVHERRGGYCFQQNSLFRDVLRELGFTVTPFIARVRWRVPDEMGTPLTHMVLHVEAEGRAWLADVGFGAVGTTAPLACDTAAEQATPHETRRLIRRGPLVVHQVRFDGVWGDVYQYAPVPPPPIDFEVGNWYSCTHPKAHFKNNLIVTRARPDGRVFIFNREFTRRALDGHAEKRDLASPDELLEILDRDFGLVFPRATRFGPPGSLWPT